MELEKFKKYIENKSIIIVGPAESLFNEEKEDFIDNFDIVCRIKKSYPIDKNKIKYTGGRTDILISHLKLGNKKYKQNNFDEHPSSVYNSLKYIIFPFPQIPPFSRFFNNFKKNIDINVPIINLNNDDNYFMLKSNLNNHDPKTGLMGINFLLSFDIKELYLTGLTFEQNGFCQKYKTKEEDNYCRERTKDIHNSNLELEYFKKLIKQDKRIKVDSTLQNII
jgi:hypothetical protein